MTATVKPLGDRFFPNMGDQYLIGLANVGLQVVSTTLELATAKTDAQVVLAPPNTDAGNKSYGAVVHSFGTPPSLVIAQLGAFVAAANVNFNPSYITADNSAIYINPRGWTQGAGPVSARIIIIR